MRKIKLKLCREVIRQLGCQDLSGVHAAERPITDGNNGCQSEATGCASICEWSCVNFSCTVASGPQGA